MCLIRNYQPALQSLSLQVFSPERLGGMEQRIVGYGEEERRLSRPEDLTPLGKGPRKPSMCGCTLLP